MSNTKQRTLMQSIPLLITSVIFLSGCSTVALPFRVTADALRVIPVVGDAVAVPFDAVGNFVDN